MEINWSTFFLEVVNFLVLVWILKRFLYKPVMNAVETRRKGIEDQIARAEAIRDEALALKAQYENELRAWAGEKDRQAAELHDSLGRLRAQGLADLQAELASEREKGRAREEEEAARKHLQSQWQALEQGGQFVATMLGQFACPQLEERLMDWFVNSLEMLPPEHQEALRKAEPAEPVTFSSAYPVSPENRKRLTEGLVRLLEREPAVEFIEDPALLAGLQVHIGSWWLDANLREELKFFTSFPSLSPSPTGKPILERKDEK